MQANVHANFGEGSGAHCRAAVLSWGEDASHLHPPFDLVIGADLLYLPELYPALVQTLDDLVGPKGECILAWERRSPTEARFLDLVKQKFTVGDVFGQLDEKTRVEFANVSLI